MSTSEAGGWHGKLHFIIDTTGIVVCGMALIFALTAGAFHTEPITIPGSTLSPVDALEPDITGSGFALNAVFSIIAPPPHITGIDLYGSAVSGDSSTGLVRTRWYRPFPHFYLLVAGYPVNKNCAIYLEVFSPKTGVVKVPLPLDENPEQWRLQRISLSAYPYATKFRIVASDNSTKTMGWLGFSPPFLIPKQRGLPAGLGTQLLLIIFCTAACLVAVLGPGIIARAYFPRLTSPVWLPIPGILLLAAIGLFAWLGPRLWLPAAISRSALSAVFLFVTLSFVRRSLTSLLSSSELRVLGIIVLLTVIAIAKSSYSIGPSGELYRGRISHSLEAGGRSDNRISYDIVHLIAIRQSGYTKLATFLFAPWSFSHRGPIAALAASPLVLCTDVKFPPVNPDQTWTLFDPEGFGAYRIAMMVLATGSLFVVFGVAQMFLDESWAILAFLVVAAAPFTEHEIFFTWPKSLAASFLFLAAYLSLRRRFFAAGFAAGVAYLCHPSVLFCFPAILAITIIGVEGKSGSFLSRFLERSRFILRACTGLAVWLVTWRVINRHHFEQDTFFRYFHYALPFPTTPFNWVHSRVINLSMTLVPMDAFLFHRFDVEMLPYDGAPQWWVQFIHQYWSTLPFGVGLFFYLAVIRLMATAFTEAKAWMCLVILPPFVLFLIYWGVGNTGLLREGLHAWVFGLLLFGVFIWNTYMAGSKQFWVFATAALGIRGLETIAMLIPFSSWSRGYVLQRPFALSDGCMLLVMLGGTALLTYIVVSQCYAIAPVTANPLHRRRPHGVLHTLHQ